MMAARSRPRPAPAPLRWCWDPGPCGRCWCGACPPRCQGAHASSRFSRLSPPGNRTIPKSRRSRVAIRRSPCSWATQSREASARSSGKSPYCRIQSAINARADPLSSATFRPPSDTHRTRRPMGRYRGGWHPDSWSCSWLRSAQPLLALLPAQLLTKQRCMIPPTAGCAPC